MSIAQAVLPEFDQEMASTRRLLERVPEGQSSWQPHPKSTPLGKLVIHISDLPGWGIMTLKETELDLNPPGGSGWNPPAFETTAKLLDRFDENVRNAREVLGSASDADYMVSWSLKNAGATIFSLPRVVVVRSFVMNHLIHHRGQLTVYLRLLNVPLPQIYGPTADEGM
jgi:uncharacterized damage-inducible protein DinB